MRFWRGTMIVFCARSSYSLMQLLDCSDDIFRLGNFQATIAFCWHASSHEGPA